MTAHANLSGSGAHRWIKCPGQPRLAKTIPRRPSGAAAQWGTAAHALSEQVMRGAKYKLGDTFRYDDHGEKKMAVAEPEMWDTVARYVNHIAEIKKTNGATLYLERHVDLANLVRQGMFGTADAVLTAKNQMWVIDFKSGFTPVRIEDEDGNPNAQLLYYAAGALDSFGWKHDVVHLQIVQPRCAEVDPIQNKSVSAEWVKVWATEILWAAAHATDDPNAKLVAGDHCKFCDAISICPAMTNKTQELAATDFEEFKAKLEVPTTPEQLAKVLKWTPVIDAWLKECAGRAHDLMAGGTKVPGYKLVKKRSNRRWPDDWTTKDVIGALRRAGFKKAVSPCDLAETTLKSPAKMGDVVGKKFVDLIAEKPDNGTTVAADSDNRPAVGNDFEELL